MIESIFTGTISTRDVSGSSIVVNLDKVDYISKHVFTNQGEETLELVRFHFQGGKDLISSLNWDVFVGSPHPEKN